MIEANDIVQITNPSHHWYPCLIVVSEVKSWGVQGYTVMPTNDDQPNGQAYIRLKSSDYERVGRAVVVSA